jgi:predicted RNA binding protein YcfA (HicA-like mRNA interferase family)
MTRLPRLTGRKVINALGRAGFCLVRSKGSHHFLRHDDGRCTVIPVHGSEVIGTGLLHKILLDCEMTAERFRHLL